MKKDQITCQKFAFYISCIGFIAKVKDKAENVGQKIQAKAESAGFGSISPLIKRKDGSDLLDKSESRPRSVGVKKSLTMEIAQLFMSCLHAWGQVSDAHLSFRTILDVTVIETSGYILCGPVIRLGIYFQLRI